MEAAIKAKQASNLKAGEKKEEEQIEVKRVKKTSKTQETLEDETAKETNEELMSAVRDTV